MDRLLGLWFGQPSPVADPAGCSEPTMPSGNALCWSMAAFGTLYWLFRRCLFALLLRNCVPAHRSAATVRHVWQALFSGATLLALAAYYLLVVGPASHRRPNAPLRFGPAAYAHALHAPAQCGRRFAHLGQLLIGWHGSFAAIALQDRDLGEALSSVGFVGVLCGLQSAGLETFAVLLNVWLGLHRLIEAVVHAMALHTRPANVRLWRMLLAVRLVGWSYVHLHLLPFDFLLAESATGRRPLWLDALLWSWYGVAVWRSPLLHFGYRRLFGRSVDDRPPEGVRKAAADGRDTAELARSVLVRETSEYRHFVQLQRAVAVIRQARLRSESGNSSGTDASRTYQTLKCMMTLKRKLKRIRRNNQNVPYVGM